VSLQYCQLPIQTPSIVTHTRDNRFKNDQIKTMKWAGHVARAIRTRNGYTIFSRGDCQRPEFKGENNIKLDLKEMRGQGVDRIHLAQVMEQLL
jgi:hypothetical protein